MNGELHPENEKGPIRFQESLKNAYGARQRRREIGGRDWPAVPATAGNDGREKGSEEVSFCEKLNSKGCLGDKGLAW
jgi:hypothetical protein